VGARSRLKRGLLVCVAILAATLVFQAESSLALGLKDALYFIETGSAASALAFCLALIPTA
jgi:hypothetical protein